MRNRLLLCTALAAGLLSAPAALAEVPKNALGAVAVSPDGGTVAAAGDNRVLYLVEPDTLAVRERILLGTNPLEMWYSADGKTLAILTTDDVVLFYSTETWEETARSEQVKAYAPALAADAIAIIGRAKKDSDGNYQTPFMVYSLVDGSVLLQATVAGNGEALAAKPDASAFAMLTRQEDDPDEPKEDPPADLKNLDKEVFKQQHDAKSSETVMLDAAGAETARAKTWFGSPSGLVGAWGGEELRFLGYHNRNPSYGADGAILGMWETPISYNYGIGVSPDQTVIAIGTLRDGALMSLADGSSLDFDLEQVPGWPEYIEGFGFAPDGSVYGATTAYRLLHIGADGRIKTIAPIY